MGLSNLPIEDILRKRKRALILEFDSPLMLSSSSSPIKRTRKSVKFAANKRNELTTQEFPSDMILTKHDKGNLWWSHNEGADIVECCRIAAQNFRRDHPASVSLYREVYDQCSQTPSEETSSVLDNDTITIPSKVRGLEGLIGPSFKTRRRKHVNNILDLQHRIRGRFNAEMRLKVLGTHAVCFSRASRIWARMVGEGDAMAAAKSKSLQKQTPPKNQESSLVTDCSIETL
jgi:hypothetical protein